MHADCLGLFVKFWEPGKVKTRLARTIGYEAAAEVARALLNTSIARFSQIAPRQVVAYAPDNQHVQEAFSTPIFDGWHAQPQVEGDLGLRITAFFQRELSTGASSVVLVGSDSPNLPIAYIRQSFEALRKHEAVVGPTEDGGYYLIGLNRPVPELFTEMPWSTNELFRATIERLEEMGTRYASLPDWYDVDKDKDLNRLLAELPKQSCGDAELAELQRRLTMIIAAT